MHNVSTGAFSSLSRNDAMLMPNNFTSTVNVATPTPDLGVVTSQSALNVATSNYHTAVPQLNCHTFQSVINGGSIGGSGIFPSTNLVLPSCGTSIPVLNQIISEQPFKVGLEGGNFQFGGNSFNNVNIQVICSSLFLILLYYYATKPLIECFKLYIDGKCAT